MEFSFARLRLLIKKQFAENAQLYFLGTLAIIGIMLFVFLTNLVSRGFNEGDQFAFFHGGLLIFGGIYACTLFSKLNDKTQGAQTLTLPASALEKVVNAMLFSLVIFPFLYCMAVYPLLLIVHYIDVDIMGRFNELFTIADTYNIKYMIVSFLCLQSFILMCSVVFKRYATIKTIVTICCIWYVVMIGNNSIAAWYFNPYNSINSVNNPIKLNVKQLKYDEHRNIVKTTYYTKTAKPYFIFGTPYNEVEFALLNDPYGRLSVDVSSNQAVIFKWMLFLAIPFLYLITWFKLREIQL